MDLQKIWINKKKIFEGVTNSIFKKEFVETIAKERMDICNSCEHISNDCDISGIGPCCKLCGCILKFKTRSMSSRCGAEEINEPVKWDAVMTQEEEDIHLNDVIDD